MNERIHNELQVWEEAFNAALALYAVLRGSHTIRVRRAEMRSGEVVAEPIDFCADLEMRASHAFRTAETRWMWKGVLQDPDSYIDLPQYMKQLLGADIERFDLGVGGHYKRLYYRVRNMVDRKKVIENEPEEDYNAGNKDSGFGTAYDPSFEPA